MLDMFGMLGIIDIFYAMPVVVFYTTQIFYKMSTTVGKILNYCILLQFEAIVQNLEQL